MLLKRQVLKKSFQISSLALTVSELLNFHLFHLEKYVNVIRCKFRNGVVRWQKTNKSTKVVLCDFALVLIVSDIFSFYIVELKHR